MKLLTICALVALMLVAVSPEANGKGGVVITTCNQTVMTNAVLGLDLVCPGSGITAAASGITIDLGGHTLRGTNPGVSFGVFVTAPDHVTVKNGVVRGFSDGITNISTGTDHLSVSNVVVSGNGTGINIGGDSPSVSKANASGNGGYGILVAGDGASVKS